MDRVIGVSEARGQLPRLLKEVAAGRHYIIAQRSKARAVLISPDDLESLEVAADKELLADLRAAKRDIRRGDVVDASAYFSKKKRR